MIWLNSISNTKLHARTDFTNINTQIRKRKFGWIGHTLRKSPNEVAEEEGVPETLGDALIFLKSTVYQTTTAATFGVCAIWSLGVLNGRILLKAYALYRCSLTSSHAKQGVKIRDNKYKKRQPPI